MNLTDRQREILKQIISNLGDENYRNMDKDWFDYDHNSFIKSIIGGVLAGRNKCVETRAVAAPATLPSIK